MSRLNSIYIYETLIKHSSKDNPMTTFDIQDSLLEDFKVHVDLTTIRRTLEDFKELDAEELYELCGNYEEGFYLKNENRLLLEKDDLFSDSELNFLYLSVACSKNLSKEENRIILSKLSKQCKNQISCDYFEENNFSYLKKDNVSSENNTYSQLNSYVEIIENKYPIKIYSNNSFYDQKIAYLYAIIPKNEELILVVTFKRNVPFLINSKDIIKYDILKNEMFPSKKPVIEYDPFFTDEIVEHLKVNYYNQFEFSNMELKKYDLELIEINKKISELKRFRSEKGLNILMKRYINVVTNYKEGKVYRIILNPICYLNKTSFIYDFKIDTERLKFLFFLSFISYSMDFDFYINSNYKINKFCEFMFNMFEELKTNNYNLYLFAIEWLKNGKSIVEIKNIQNWTFNETLKYKDEFIKYLGKSEITERILKIYKK